MPYVKDRIWKRITGIHLPSRQVFGLSMLIPLAEIALNEEPAYSLLQKRDCSALKTTSQAVAGIAAATSHIGVVIFPVHNVHNYYYVNVNMSVQCEPFTVTLSGCFNYVQHGCSGCPWYFAIERTQVSAVEEDFIDWIYKMHGQRCTRNLRLLAEVASREHCFQSGSPSNRSLTKWRDQLYMVRGQGSESLLEVQSFISLFFISIDPPHWCSQVPAICLPTAAVNWLSNCNVEDLYANREPYLLCPLLPALPGEANVTFMHYR
ncbi:hypothetical protein EDD85DRAFT_797385 [Armillaria nabsnona]|nr:hypothetical protein EDD85DRAFT_797385 [Armillaria nabsnona]